MTDNDPSNPLKRAFLVEKRVIGALLLREVMTRYGRHNIGFLWLFVEPMIFTLGIVTLWSMFKASHGTEIPIAAFALTGYSSILLWRNMPGRCIHAIEPNMSLLYHRNVKVMDIYISRILLEFLGASMSFFVLSIIFITVGLIQPPEDLAKVALGWIMLVWFGASLALLVGTLSESSDLVEKFWHPASYLIFPLSGAAFIVDIMPPAAQRYLLLLPMVNGVELLRDGYFGSIMRAHYDLNYMAMCCLVLTLLGVAQLRRIGREVVPE
ncbi:ABC transporter permease [Novosphingobium sp. Chol11]|uniref:ABC transporter permease n=1 Tax=Novosphingobium sp. Chol11 TaxID=1385763 RepID=UPI000BE40617|nr:ABC transporter permease [Novosphingobium sp. Chol11]